MLKVYDRIRRPRANMILEGSIRMGDIYDSFGLNHCTPEEMRQRLSGKWNPVWLHDIEGEVTEAIEAVGRQ